MAEVLTTIHARAGMNFAKCPCDGVIPFSFNLHAMARLDHTCDETRVGTCKRCGRRSSVRFIRTKAPALGDEVEDY